MGAQLSIITPSAPTIAINSYTSELSNIHYEKTISNGRFLKTIKAASVDGKVIVKIFIKPDEGFKLDKIGKQLQSMVLFLIFLINFKSIEMMKANMNYRVTE